MKLYRLMKGKRQSGDHRKCGGSRRETHFMRYYFGEAHHIPEAIEVSEELKQVMARRSVNT